ncbi:MAG: DNRLRE domain-containing protein [Desulfobacteraceae bacterium]|nr:MAG: DNRLRE domain-containing protein [Desulfobacteraceae bacterium]
MITMQNPPIKPFNMIVYALMIIWTVFSIPGTDAAGAARITDGLNSVDLAVNAQDSGLPELLDMIIEGDEPPPYRVKTSYSLAIVTRGLTPGNRYTFAWYVNGKQVGTGQSITYRFHTPGEYRLKVMMISTDPSENQSLRGKISIEPIHASEVDFIYTPKNASKPTLESGDSIVFTQQCRNPYRISEYRWYVNDAYVKSGPEISLKFTEPGHHDVTLGIRKGSSYDVAELTKRIRIRTRRPDEEKPDMNRFVTRGGHDDLSVCSQQWKVSKNIWSKKCKIVSRIGPVDGFALCTGPRTGGFNTGFLVYIPRGGGRLLFQVYHFDSSRNRGRVHYSGHIPGAALADPVSLSISCTANAAQVRWTGEDGKSCNTRIWKFRRDDLKRHYGVETPVCSGKPRGTRIKPPPKTDAEPAMPPKKNIKKKEIITVPKPVLHPADSIRLPPVADSYVYADTRKNLSRTNQGLSQVLGAGWHPTGGEKRTFIKFDLSAFKRQRLNRAVLRLYHTRTGGRPALDLGVFKLLSSWSEGRGSTKNPAVTRPGDISWINQPRYVPAPSVVFHPGPGENKFVEIDISPLVQSWLAGSPNHGLMIKCSSPPRSGSPESQYAFYSKEFKDAAKRPELIISGVRARSNPGQGSFGGTGSTTERD